MSITVNNSFYSSQLTTSEEQAQRLYMQAMDLDISTELNQTEDLIQQISAYLNQAIELNPNHVGAHIALGVLLIYSEIEYSLDTLNHPNRDLAISYLTKAIELNPAYADEHFTEGTAQFMRGSLLLANILPQVKNNQIPSAEEIEQIEADMIFALNCGFEEAQMSLDALAQIKQIQ